MAFVQHRMLRTYEFPERSHYSLSVLKDDVCQHLFARHRGHLHRCCFTRRFRLNGTASFCGASTYKNLRHDGLPYELSMVYRIWRNGSPRPVHRGCRPGADEPGHNSRAYGHVICWRRSDHRHLSDLFIYRPHGFRFRSGFFGGQLPSVLSSSLGLTI